jgi:hypothetical protein
VFLTKHPYFCFEAKLLLVFIVQQPHEKLTDDVHRQEEIAALAVKPTVLLLEVGDTLFLLTEVASQKLLAQFGTLLKSFELVPRMLLLIWLLRLHSTLHCLRIDEFGGVADDGLDRK